MTDWWERGERRPTTRRMIDYIKGYLDTLVVDQTVEEDNHALYWYNVDGIPASTQKPSEVFLEAKGF